MKIVIGDKVAIPKTKRNEFAENSVVIKLAKEKNQNYLYYTGTSLDRNDKKVYVLSENPYKGRVSGDYFDWKDLVPYKIKSWRDKIDKI